MLKQEVIAMIRNTRYTTQADRVRYSEGLGWFWEPVGFYPILLGDSREDIQYSLEDWASRADPPSEGA